MTYRKIPFMRFALGVIVAGLPLAVMGEKRKWASIYIVLLVLGFAVTHWRGLERASSYFRKELK